MGLDRKTRDRQSGLGEGGSGLRLARNYQTGKHLEAFILLLIAKEPAHGGAVIARLKDFLPNRWTVDDGQVYRLLRSLEAEGALQSHWQTDLGGPAVRVYHLTPSGQRRLHEWKDDIALRVESLSRFLDLWSQIFVSDAKIRNGPNG
jgi:DNA-binding PadR family transcriptional regulator